MRGLLLLIISISLLNYKKCLTFNDYSLKNKQPTLKQEVYPDKMTQFIMEFKDRYKLDRTNHSKKEIKIAIIDTGILKINGIEKYIYNPKNKPNFYGYDYTGTGIEDTHGHGTHIAGIILGVNENAKIIPIKFYNPAQSGIKNYNNYLKALKKAISLKVDIINFSGNGSYSDNKELRLLKLAKSKNIMVITALGNNGKNTHEINNYPFNYQQKNSLTNMIGAININIHKNSISDDSNYCNNCQAFGLVGESIVFGRLKFSGTSQSTAFLSGIVSIILQKTTTKDILPTLKHNSVIITGSGLGLGTINLQKITKSNSRVIASNI